MSGGGQVEYSAPFPLLHSAMAKMCCEVVRNGATFAWFRDIMVCLDFDILFA